MNGHFCETHSRPADPVSFDAPSMCINCEHSISPDEDWVEDGNDAWCEYCWSRRPKDEDASDE